MKRQLFLSVLIGFTLVGFSQSRAIIPTDWQNRAEKRVDFYFSFDERNQTALPLKYNYLNDEEITGNTWYDLQSNGSMQNRVHVFDDGTIGVVYNIGFNYPSFSSDRGTGYNYFNGYGWGDWPTERIEDDRTGWPAYAPFGEGGEIIVSHISDVTGEGLIISKRQNKGTGEWEQLNFTGPLGFEELLFPKMATGGINNSTIHLLAATYPITPYQGQEMALLYSRSTDGGISWNPENYILPEINADYYVGFDADNYDLRAEGDNVAILIGGPWIDLLLLKSIDGGNNWEKAIIWEHPYPLFEIGSALPTDTFYCVDGSLNLDFDTEGMVHIIFGINRTYSDGAGTFWFPAVGGIGYWNENRPTFSNDMNALNPYGHPDSELEENYSLVGWSPDINGNDTIDVLDDWGTYYLGFSSMPQIYVDENNRIYVVYSSVTEGSHNDVQNYRHLWCRLSPSHGEWWGQLHLLTDELFHIYDECVFPSLARYTDDWPDPQILYQVDHEPGMAVRGDEDPYGENFIYFSIFDIWVYTGNNEHGSASNLLEVSQNQPNPFKGKTTIKIKLLEPKYVFIDVTNLTGKKVLENDLGYLNTETHNIDLNAHSLQPGLYFYTVVAGEHSVTKKMIVK